MLKKVFFLSVILMLILAVQAYAQPEKGETEKVMDTSKAIQPTDLEGLTLRDLWLMRNEIFARHGRPFKTYELHAYFMSKGLEPDQEYSADRLTPDELKNVEMITAKENELLKKNYIKGPSGESAVNLGNVLNLFQYAEFTEDQKEKLSENGFVVTPARYGQLFNVYEKNSYLGIPSFITTDSVLQLYSIFFDFTLRRVEETYLMNTLKTLTEEMMKYSEEIYLNANDPLIKEAARSNLAYYTVPYYLLTGDETKIHPDVREMVMQELELVKKHEMIAPPPILKSNKPEYEEYKMRYYWPDYSQFIPRGHYSRSERLTKYFMASLWLGLYHMHPEEGFEHETVQGILTTHLLYTKAVDGRPLIELWKDIYEPTVFYVGLSDDIGPDDFKGIIDEVYGRVANMSAYSDRAKLQKVQKLIYEIYEDKTKIKFVWDSKTQGPRFMLMGQRYIPDSEVMQRLVGSNLDKGHRAFPKGLDVTAAFGSRLAKELMLTKYEHEWDEEFPVYPEKLEELITEFGKLSEADWKKNLYFNWIWTLKSLIELNRGKDYPFFTQKKAWEAKNLNTSLASWSQLRHHTILYAKQSFFGAECGGGKKEYVLWVPEPPKGYVEPNVAFYRRMLELLELSESGLKERNLVDPLTVELFGKFREIVEFLDSVAEKELNNKPRSLEEYERIRILGAELDNLTFRVITTKERASDHFDWSSIDERDRIIPVIADVHTAYEYGVMNVLEEAVGYANIIYVVVEDEGKLRLTRGAVMSYYEFKWPAEDRLTDGKWQKILKDKKAPPVPEWTDMFLSKEPAHQGPPMYIPEPSYYPLPRWSTEPGWKTFSYEGC